MDSDVSSKGRGRPARDWFLTLSWAYIGAAMVAVWAYSGEARAAYFGEMARMAVLCTALAVVTRYTWLLVRDRPDSPFDHLRHYPLRRDLEERLSVLVTVSLFVASYLAFKSCFHAIHQFSWDRQLAALDTLLHGGVAPWRCLDCLFRHRAGLVLLDVTYSSWFLVLFGVLLHGVFRQQWRLLLSFVTTWILLGTVAAIWLSSAGPCYYRLAAEGPDVYAPLMERLRCAGLWTVCLQEGVRQSAGQQICLGGVSAMPSMHVATAVLFALWAWNSRRRCMAWAFTAYAAATQVACVYLGWHYAVDGYVAAAGTFVIWRMVGLAVREPRPAMTSLAGGRLAGYALAGWRIGRLGSGRG